MGWQIDAGAKFREEYYVLDIETLLENPDNANPRKVKEIIDILPREFPFADAKIKVMKERIIEHAAAEIGEFEHQTTLIDAEVQCDVSTQAEKDEKADLPPGYEMQGGRITRKQTTRRPPHIWPELWRQFSKTDKARAEAEYKASIDPLAVPSGGAASKHDDRAHAASYVGKLA